MPLCNDIFHSPAGVRQTNDVPRRNCSHDSHFACGTYCTSYRNPTELGDGEPSPPPELKRENFDLMCGACKLRLGNHLGYECPGRRGTFFELESGAAQEVSPPATGTSSDPRTGYLKQEVSPPSPDTAHIWDSITRVAESRHDYGVCTLTRSACQKLIGERLHGGDTRELKAALKECVKQMKDAASLLEMFPDDYGEAINRAEKLLG